MIQNNFVKQNIYNTKHDTKQFCKSIEIFLSKKKKEFSLQLCRSYSSAFHLIPVIYVTLL